MMLLKLSYPLLNRFTLDLLLMASTEEAFENAKAILGEQFQHYAIVVQYDDGSVWHESNNQLVEKALYHEALGMIREEKEYDDSDIELEWDEDDDDDGWETVDEEVEE